MEKGSCRPDWGKDREMRPPGGWWPLSKDGVLIWDRRGETDTEEEQRQEGSGHKARGPWRHRKLGEAGAGAAGAWSLALPPSQSGSGLRSCQRTNVLCPESP